MKNIINLIVLIIISLSFIACEEKEKRYVTAEEMEELHKKAVENGLYDKKFPTHTDMPEPKERDNELRQMKINNLWYQAVQHGKPEAATEIAMAYYEQLEDYEKAIEWLEYSNSIKPTGKNSDQACIIFQDIKKFEEAIPWCKQAYELGNELSLVGLALAYRGVKNYDEAINYLNIGIEKNIKNSSNVLGLVYSEKGDYKEAEKWYLKAIKDEPYNSRAHNNISSFYIEDLKDNVKGAAHAIAGIDNVFDVLSVSDLLIIEYKIPLEDLQEAYKLQLTSPDFPIRFKEKGRRVGFLTKEDYQEVIDDYYEDKRREQETIKYEEAQRKIAKEFNERVQRDIEEKEKQQKENER